MLINIYEKGKIMAIWLTNTEINDSHTQPRLQSLYKQNRARKYLTVVYYAGTQDLIRLTSNLLKYNRRLAAEHEVKAEYRLVENNSD